MNRYLNLTAKIMNHISAGCTVVILGWICLMPLHLLSFHDAYIGMVSVVVYFTSLFILASGKEWRVARLLIWTDIGDILRGTRYECTVFHTSKATVPLNTHLYWTNYEPWSEGSLKYGTNYILMIAYVLSNEFPGHLFRLNLLLTIPSLILLSWLLIGKFYRAKNARFGASTLVSVEEDLFCPGHWQITRQA